MSTAAEGGAGGKFRKKPFRRAATPYDRPPTALRAAGAADNGGWLSKLVDPASRLLTSGAHRLFASVFRKRLPAPPVVVPPPPPPLAQESNPDGRCRVQEVLDDPPGAQDTNAVDGNHETDGCDGSGIAELEQMLKQKTFTRCEIDRLKELLHAKSRDEFPVSTEKRPTDFLEADPVQDILGGSSGNAVKENGFDSGRGVISTPVGSLKVSEVDIAAPTELAKAYMGSRPSKVSPSMLGFRSQVRKEDESFLSNTSRSAFSPNLSFMAPAPKCSVSNGLPDNGFMTPRSHGRSSIYRMSRTPYSRVLPHKGSQYTGDGYGGQASSSSPSMWERNGLSQSRQLGLKRRSSALDDDTGSVGPIRRIRQKSNLLSEKSLSSSVSGVSHQHQGTNVSSITADLALPSVSRALVLDKSNRKNSNVTASRDEKLPAASFSSVPSQSRETAAKILQHLDKLVSSSPLKDKSPELKLAAARVTSPAKLTKDMLNGQALRSMEKVDTPIFLRSVDKNEKLVSPNNTGVADIRDSVFQRQDKVKENGVTGTVAPATHSLNTTVQSDGPASNRCSNTASSIAVGNSSLKKRAFQMSAHEDYLDLDDDDYTNEGASAALADGNIKLGSPVKNASAAAIRDEKIPYSSEFKPPPYSLLDKRSNLETNDAVVVNEKHTAHPVSSSTTSSRSVQPSFSQSSSAFNSVIAPKELSAATPHFSSGKLGSSPAISFSLPCDGDAASLDKKVEVPSSFSSVPTEPEERLLESQTSGGKGAGEDENNVAPSVAQSSSASSSTLSANNNMSIGISAKSDSFNGSFPLNPTFPSLPPAVSANSSNSQFSSSLSAVSTASLIVISSTTTTAASPPGTAASCSSVTSTPAALSSPQASIFKFGSSAAAAVPVLPTSITSGTEAVLETGEGKSFGSQPATLSDGGRPTVSSSGNFTFGLASVSASAANNPSQGSSPFGIGSGTSGTVQASSSASGVAVFSNGTPNIFGTSVSSAALVPSGSASLASGSSTFGYSTSAADVFSSKSSFGLTSFGSSAGSNSNGSTMGSMPQLVSGPSTFASGTTSTFTCTNPFASGTSSSFPSSTTSQVTSVSTSPFPSSTTSQGTSVSTSPFPSVTSSTFASTKNSFSSSSAPTKPLFASTFSSTNPSTGITFGESSSSTPSSSAQGVFGSSSASSSGSLFSFTSPTVSNSTVFGSLSSVFALGSGSTGNNDLTNMEDSMAEDNSQASTPAPTFSQPPVNNPPGFMFNAAAPSATFQFSGQQNQPTPQNSNPFQFSQNQPTPQNPNPFQFGGQPNQSNPPNPSPFSFNGQQNQPTPTNPNPFQPGSLDISGGGSFSLGSGGASKSNRKMIKVRKGRK